MNALLKAHVGGRLVAIIAGAIAIAARGGPTSACPRCRARWPRASNARQLQAWLRPHKGESRGRDHELRGYVGDPADAWHCVTTASRARTAVLDSGCTAPKCWPSHSRVWTLTPTVTVVSPSGPTRTRAPALRIVHALAVP